MDEDPSNEPGFYKIPQEMKNHLMGFLDANDRVSIKMCSRSMKKDFENCPQINLHAIYIDSDKGEWKTQLKEDSAYEEMTEANFLEKIRKVDNIDEIYIESLGKTDAPLNVFGDEPAARQYLKSVKMISAVGCRNALHVLKRVKPVILEKVTVITFSPEVEESRKILDLQQVILADEVTLSGVNISNEQFLRLTGQKINLTNHESISRAAVNRFIKNRIAGLKVRDLELKVAVNSSESVFQSPRTTLEKGTDADVLKGLRVLSINDLYPCIVTVDTPHNTIKLWITFYPIHVRVDKIVTSPSQLSYNQLVALIIICSVCLVLICLALIFL